MIYFLFQYRYHSSTRILGTTINGTLFYDPPKISVHQDNLLKFNIHRGLILAKCLPDYNNSSKPAILFKAEFNNLSGSGKILLDSTSNSTRVRLSLDQLDLSSIKTKLFKPKLPLPEAFESQLIKSAISQLQPIINQYLSKKRFYLPENILPLAAALPPSMKVRLRVRPREREGERRREGGEGGCDLPLQFQLQPPPAFST